MSIKEDVLKILIKNDDKYISGESLAKKLYVSRNSVWKAIKSLQNDGYEISAITNKGYCLLSSNDILSKEGIFKYLKNPDFFNIDVFSKVTSTSTLLKEQANNDEPEGKVIVSSHQTSGRGRLGRNFYSPTDTGVYFSFLLRPNFSADKSVFLTTLASIAVSNAIGEITGEIAKVKWVNDIFVNDKKVCGILCEASYSLENFNVDFVTLGIGINVYSPKDNFPSDISEIAGSILDNKIDDTRNKLVAQILDNFIDLYRDFDIKKIHSLYKELSFVLNKKIYVIKRGENILATAIDINENCNLVVKYEDGTIETLDSGEISTKIIK